MWGGVEKLDVIVFVLSLGLLGISTDKEISKAYKVSFSVFPVAEHQRPIESVFLVFLSESIDCKTVTRTVDENRNQN